MALCEEEEEEKTCRLCFSGEDDGPLVQLCACRGTAKFVHCSLGVADRAVTVSQGNGGL